MIPGGNAAVKNHKKYVLLAIVLPMMAVLAGCGFTLIQ